MSAAPIIDRFAPGAPLGLHPEGIWSAGAFLAQAQALALRFPGGAGGACGLLLCEDRLAFALGLAASLWQRATVLLPPSHAPATLAELCRLRQPRFALVDRAGTVDGVEEIVVTPAAATADVVARAPDIPFAQVAVVVYTSGTTGEPQAHAKTWGSLVRGAAALRARTRFASGNALVGAVPAQHMWGLEATIVLPLQSGGVIHPGTPLLPLDLAAALHDAPQPRWLVLTPLHARSCVQAGVPLPPLAGVLSATAPLDRALAASFEQLASTTLTEIYGSSETGAIATRMPARETRFVPLDGIALAASDTGIVVSGGHLSHGVALSDHASIGGDGSFVLTGRDADLVKVGGKRGSLTMLNRVLREIPGVEDGEFVVGAQEGATQRLAAVVVAPSIDRGQVVAALRTRIDPVFLPRPLCFVDALPRNALGKLPAAMLHRIVADCAAANGRAGGRR